jgi:hypothetical protein
MDNPQPEATVDKNDFVLHNANTEKPYVCESCE